MTVSKSYPDTYQIVDHPAGNPPAGTVWLWRTPSGWVEKRSDGTTLKLTPDQAFETGSTSASPLSHSAAAAAIDKTVIEWQNQGYKADRIVVRQNAFFKCVIAHTEGFDPLTDKDGHWIKFPEDGSVIGANRSPTVSDKHPEGTIWADLSFGSTTPLRFITTGDGLWLPLNQIVLSRIRFDLYGTGSTYQSRLSNIKFFKADGTEMPNSWFVWGNRAGIGGQSAGTNYTGQAITPQYNTSGWAELEPSASYDLKESISKITGSLAYATFRSVTFFYSNGGSKFFTPSGGNLATCEPPIASRFGDSTISAQGEILTPAKLSDSTNKDPGRVTGEAFVQAWNILSQAISGKIEELETKIATLEARQEVRRSPDLPDFALEWDIWERVVVDRVAWTITVTDYIRVDQDSAFPIAMRPAQGEPPISLPLPNHADAKPNAQGDFVSPIPGGGEFVYGTNRNGSNNYFTFAADTYKEVASYYVDANDAAIPGTTTAQIIAAGSTALGIGASAAPADAVAFVVDFYKLDNSKITYRIPLT